MNEKTLGLYFHIPFCINKCLYCDFYSKTNLEMTKRYVDSLLLHMQDYSDITEKYEVDTVFFGGGTPTALHISELAKIIDGIYNCFFIKSDAEFTVEANPASVTLSDLKKLRKKGVNRLSIGLQSTNESELKALGRIHTFDDFLRSYSDARKAGFQNISVDLMYGIPNQSKNSFTETLKKLCDLNPEHISLYNLRIEEGTPFAIKRQTLTLPDEDEESEMYFSAVDYLRQGGWLQYEISNFSKPGKQCLHNLKYWNCLEYIGFGPGAHSYFGGRRFAYRKNIEAYICNSETPGSISDILSEDYCISPKERLGEYVMLRMRLTEGVDADEFYSLFGIDFEKMFEKYLSLYVSNGFMKHEGRKYSFTTKGMYVSNYILSAMLDFDSDIINGVVSGSDR